ncbi:hypothetical protein [Pseudolysinimonas yzui]|uniref:hypothetical protein n=1 Tax=Pseudolysinimonas yzui TaxID=2708254 RepID=UPI00174CDAAF|nr:hypothetical protein [Pseudolysinimonas yzui]
MEYVAELAERDGFESADGQKAGGLGSEAALDPCQTVSILGDRGSGKTYTLAQVCAQLELDDRYLVTRVIRPEFFDRGDTLYSVLLASMMASINEDEDLRGRRISYRGEERSAAGWLDELAFKEASGRHGTLGTAGAWTLDEQAQALVSVSRRGLGFVDEWRALIDGLLASTGRTLVIPVDDADLAPGMLPQILLDIRRIASTPRVVCIAALSYEHAQRSFAASVRDGTAGDVGYRDAIQFADAALTKSLPTHRRVHLHPLSDEAKLTFTPVGATESLEGLLGQIWLPSHITDEETALSELFRVPLPKAFGDRRRNASLGVTPYASALPSGLRDLEFLYKAIERHKSSGSAAAWRVALELLHVSLRHVDPALANELENLVRFSGADAESVDADFSEIKTQPWSESPRQVDVGTDYVVFYRRFHPVLSIGQGAKLPLELAQSVLLMLDVAARTLNPDIQVRGRRPYAGGFGTRLADVYLDGKVADHFFLALPTWEGFSDYYAFFAYWEWACERLAAVEKSLEITTQVTERVALAHLMLVAAVQRSELTSVVTRLGRVLDPDLPTGATWTRRRNQALDRVHADLATAYEAAVNSRSQRDRDFVAWFERYLPLGFHPMFLGKSGDDHSWEWWIDVVRRAKRRHKTEGLVRALETRIRENLGEQWIEPLLDGLGRLDLSSADKLRDRHIEAIQSRAAKRLGELALQVSTALDGREPGAGKPAQAQTAKARDELFAVAHEELESIRRSAAAHDRE